MIDRPALRGFGKIAEKWRALAETRRAYFSELHRSGRWTIYYDEDALLRRIREVTEICDRWEKVIEELRHADPAPGASAIDRDAA